MLAPPVAAAGTQWRVGEVIETIAETPRVSSLVLRIPGWPGHRPGQHVDVRLTAEDGYQAVRSYSIASAPEDGERIMITVEALDEGEVSSYLVGEVRPGDPLELLGPIGGYFTWTVPQGGPLVLVAGGSGIAPLMAMIRHRARAAGGRDVPVTLLASFRSVEDIIYHDELAALARQDAALTVIHTLTRSQPPGWTGYRRRIDAAMLEEVAGLPAPGSRAYVCGPTRLVEEVAANLLALGYPPHRVKTERFGPTGG